MKLWQAGERAWGHLTEMGRFEPDADCFSQATELGWVVANVISIHLSTSISLSIHPSNLKALDISMDD